VSVAVKCPNCGAKISAEHARCPRCRAVMAAPDPAIARQRSQRLMIITKCINSVREARKLAPENAAISHNLGVALHRRGVDDVAVDEFKKARELASGQPLTVLGLAVSCDKLGRSAEAVEAYQEFQ
jgi:Flp pilus assembly protein TadD